MKSTYEESNPYWLFTWLESKKISSREQAEAALNHASALSELRDIAENWTGSDAPIKTGHNLVAGTGLRLDDYLTCPNPPCRRRQVDVLFRHAWHYFDRVLLPDGVGTLLRNPPEEWDAEQQIDALIDLIDVAIHIQQIGAAPLVQYYSPQPTILDADSMNPKLERWNQSWSRVEAMMNTPERFEIEKIDGRKFRVHYRDPLLEVTSSLLIALSKDEPLTEQTVRDQVAHHILHGHIVELERDLSSAHLLKGTLGSSVWSHAKVLSDLSEGPDSSNVLFELTFPSLADVPIHELMSIRLTEEDAFLAFRSALTKAVREMKANGKADDARALAEEVRIEWIEPELAKLRTRLNSAQKALRRKAYISAGITGISTLCGLKLGAGAGAAVGTGLGLLASGISRDTSKYYEEKEAIELSDMFFLWQALKHAA